jgi:hypothetical protein
MAIKAAQRHGLAIELIKEARQIAHRALALLKITTWEDRKHSHPGPSM